MSIICDISLIRTVLTFFCYSILPGFLILSFFPQLISNDDKNIIIIAIGMGIAFFMLNGILINLVLTLFKIDQPLALYNILPIMTIIILLLTVLAYYRGSLVIFKVKKLNINTRSILILTICLSLLVSTITGRLIMDSGGTNRLLVSNFIFILVFFLFLIRQYGNTINKAYPLSLYFIGLSILLSRSLISNYLFGGDIHAEYQSFTRLLTVLQWDNLFINNQVDACMGITILPVLYQKFLGVDSIIIFKVVLISIIALLPVIVYEMYKNDLGPLYSFITAFFYISQIPFFYLLTGQLRVGISLFFGYLLFYLLFDNLSATVGSKVICITFLLCTILSYYVTPIFFIFMLLLYWLFNKTLLHIKKGASIPTSFILLSLVLIFFYWGQITDVAFSGYVTFASNIITNIGNMFIEEMRSPVVHSIFTYEKTSVLSLIPGFIQRGMLIMIALGVIALVVRPQAYERLSKYRILIFASFLLLIGEIILPWVSHGYGADRLYLQLLFYLAPVYIVACDAISKTVIKLKHINNIFKQKLQLVFCVVTISIIFMSSSFLYHELIGIRGREILDNQSDVYQRLYIYDSDVYGARWISHNNPSNLPIYTNLLLHFPSTDGLFMYVSKYPEIVFNLIVFGQEKETKIEDGYVLVRHIAEKNNKIEGFVYAPDDIAKKIEIKDSKNSYISDTYSYFFDKQNRIYANGQALSYEYNSGN